MLNTSRAQAEKRKLRNLSRQFGKHYSDKVNTDMY